MRIQYCDRCGVELIEGKLSGHLTGVADADECGHGDITHKADLCRRCYREFVAWVIRKKPA
jgi:hypothetical protein